MVVGVISGPSALAAAKASEPPIDWGAIIFAFVGSVVAALFVLGIQIYRSKPKYGRLALRFFEPLSVWVLGSGFGALVISTLAKEFGPVGVFFLAIGLGLLLGVAISSLAYRARFKDAL